MEITTCETIKEIQGDISDFSIAINGICPICKSKIQVEIVDFDDYYYCDECNNFKMSISLNLEWDE
jgi:hypothetical protein